MRVRLTRVGGRKNPIWRVVVADQRSPRDGRVIETVGRYNAQRQPSEIVLDRERIEHWLARGAQPTATVKRLLLADSRETMTAAAGPAKPKPKGAAEKPAATEEPAPAEEPAAAEPSAEADAPAAEVPSEEADPAPEAAADAGQPAEQPEAADESASAEETAEPEGAPEDSK